LLRDPRVRPRAASFSCLQKKQENTEETKAMPFQKGESGNPAGRPRGIVNRATALAQNLLSERAEWIARKVIELAEAGDMAAIRVCMERLARLASRWSKSAEPMASATQQSLGLAQEPVEAHSKGGASTGNHQHSWEVPMACT
jgi:hypothetical protein